MPDQPPPPEALTERELDILRLMADDLSNREIAETLFLTVGTVKWYNQQIYGKLGVGNRAQAVARAQALGLMTGEAQIEQVTSAPGPAPASLPAQSTPFIGRQHELVDLANLLVDLELRLVTVLAPGGMGKTRLALAAAGGQRQHFADGVLFVPLASLSASDAIVTAIAEQAGFTFYGEEAPRQQLLDYLRKRHTLLVLDNFEHLLDGASLVAEILQHAPDVTVLVTSRERLNLSGETVYALAGLPFLNPETFDEALAADAVQLFLQSARRIRPDFDIQPDDLPSLVRICHLTGGMPLALVLAAAWLDMLTLDQVAAELQHGMDILETELRDVPERHRSVRASFDYSWARLEETERAVFMKLSVFRGGFTVEAAQAVAGANLRQLRRLVDKSLVQTLPGGRYDVHELLRQYAHDQLSGSGKESSLREAHAAYYADFMAEHWLQMKDHRQQAALRDVELDIDNARVAWDYWIEQENILKLKQMLHGFWMVYDIRGWYLAGIQLFEQSSQVMRAVSTEESTLCLGWLLVAQGLFRGVGGVSPREGFDLVQQGTQILRKLARVDDMMIVPFVSAFLVASLVNEKSAAVEAAQMCLETASQLGDPWGMAKAKQALAMCAIEEAHYEEAERLAHEALVIYESSGDTWSMSVLCIEVLAVLAITLQEYDTAITWIKRGLAAASKGDFHYSQQMAYWQLGFVAALQENYLEAGTYWDQARASGDRVVGGRGVMGFGGSGNSVEWGGRKLIDWPSTRQHGPNSP